MRRTIYRTKSRRTHHTTWTRGGGGGPQQGPQQPGEKQVQQGRPGGPKQQPINLIYLFNEYKLLILI